MLTSGQELDIVEVRGHTVKQYVNNDSIIDLTPYLDAWDDAPDILPLANSIARTVDNTPYLIPQSFYIKA